ncbi:MAG: NYN domain-containing protein [Gemmatimonadota bacterium]
MNSRTPPRVNYPTGAQQQQYHPAPNAALLIDFDNVTMAIRSDLGKELKTLLNSDVIRGKVAVQRAYADWRRYPQYIVPLAESSVDLIFAPAYGSSKKNATDLRMAIDAMELVFIRPEIGTFILMTGDSDFSSCVLKLKEYGKYVIGVGMRESSSDLLIQNCDEYYSYHSISGLTREGDVEHSKEDPWVLVKRAVQQMVKNNDVMRTDRLKQVMLDIDSGFDEKKIGYSKFSRFVSEAASKGLLRLKKMENGQYEIVDAEQLEPSAEPKTSSREQVVERIVADAEATGNGRQRRGRGGRDDRGRREPPPQEATPAAEATPEEQPAPRKDEAPATKREEPVSAQPQSGGDITSAYALLQEAVRRLGGGDGKGVRDGDVKRKMLDLASSFDETRLGFSKFTRFLRQAHDEEIIDLARAGGGNYEVSLSSDGRQLPPPQLTATAGGAVQTPERAGPAAGAKPAAEARRAEPSKPEEREPEAATPSRAPSVGALRGRRGGRAAPDGPPPILPGQAIRSPLQSEEVVAGGKAAESASAGSAEAAEEEPAKTGRGRSRSRRGRGGRDKAAEAEAGVAPQPETKSEAPAEKPVEKKPSVSRSRRGRRSTAEEAGPPPILEGQKAAVPEIAASADAGKTTKKATRSGGTRAKKSPPKAPAAFSARALGLPTTAGKIRSYLGEYKGVGEKTTEALIETFGSDVFEALQDKAPEVRQLLGDRRAKTLLDQWAADYEKRAGGKAPAAGKVSAAKKPATAKKSAAADSKSGGSRARRGSRGRGGAKKDSGKSS